MARPSNQNAEQILEAAVELAAEVGLAGIGPRPLLSRKGIHRSAVSYHFGDRGRLVEEVYRRILDLRFSRLSDAVSSARADLPHLNSLGGLLYTAHATDCLSDAGHSTFLAEVHCSASEYTPAMHALRAGDIARRHELWRVAADMCGAPNDWHAWHLLSEGATEFAILGRTPAEKLAWLPESAARLADRLAGRTIRPAREGHDQPPGPGNEDHAYGDQALAVVTGASDLLLARKSITFRALSAASGVPLSTIKSLFPDIEDVVLGAYRMMHRRVFGTTPPQASIAGPLSMGVHFTGDSKPQGILDGLRAVAVIAARSRRLHFLGAEMRHQRGRTTVRQLIANGVADADRIDGLIWTLLTVGTVNEATCRPPNERQAWIDRNSLALRKALFGL